MTKSNPNTDTSPRLIRRKEVQAMTGLGASSIYAEMAKGNFPKSIVLSERRVAWIESEVSAWIAERIAKHQAKAKAMEV